MAFAIALIFLASCGIKRDDAEALSSASWQRRITVQRLFQQYMPQAAADGVIKTAIVRNLSISDHARQFLEACVSEGRSMGFTVDTFVTNGNNERCRNLMAKIALADYDGIILSQGSLEFTAAALQPVIEKGIKIVTFDALPYNNGDPNGGILPGLTSTAQDDQRLAQISLDALIAYANGVHCVNPVTKKVNNSQDSVTSLESQVNGGARPARVIRVWFGPGIPPLDARQKVYDEYVRLGKIEEAAVICPRDFVFAAEGARESLAAMLPRIPEGSVDAIWAPYDEFARGCMDALNTAGRKDIRLVSVDISNDDIKMMLDNAAVWLCTAAADPALAGLVNMRILAAKLAGEPTPDTYTFPVRLVETAQLTRMVNMSNITLAINGWESDAGIFDQYSWMDELKAARGKQFRPPHRNIEGTVLQ
jgi:simple sugar transport system substrate-binding protein